MFAPLERVTARLFRGFQPQKKVGRFAPKRSCRSAVDAPASDQALRLT